MANILQESAHSLRMNSVRRLRVAELQALAAELGVQVEDKEARTTFTQQALEGLRDVVVTCEPGKEDALRQYMERVKALPPFEPSTDGQA